MREVYLRSLCLYQLCDGKLNIESKYKKEIINTIKRKLQSIFEGLRKGKHPITRRLEALLTVNKRKSLFEMYSNVTTSNIEWNILD